MTALHEIWRRTVPKDVDHRYQVIRDNLTTIQAHGWLPQKAERILDVGFGSGAGAIALKEIYPKAEIIAIDNAATQQRDSDYQRRSLPKWTNFIVIEEDICSGD